MFYQRAIFWVFSFLFLGHAWAADVDVTPGVNTLSEAVEAASAGDTLILKQGAYIGPVTINKSLLLRSYNRSMKPFIGGGNLVIEGQNIDVLIQGLEFPVSIVVNQGADIKIVENLFFLTKA